MEQFFYEYGSLAIFVSLIMLVIPTEIILALGGFLIVAGYTDFHTALIAAVSGGVLSQLIIYYIARIGGRKMIHKLARYSILNTKGLATLELWFKEYGSIVLIAARIVPGPRSLASVVSGLANTHVLVFTFYTTMALLPVSAALLVAGRELGRNWHQLATIIEAYIPFAIVATIGVIVLSVFIKRKVVTWRIRIREKRLP